MTNFALSLNMLQAVAAMNPDEFTIDKNTFEPITAGYSVAVADTQNSFDTVGAAKVLTFANHHQNINAIGGWYNSENKKYYFDAVIICDNLQDAITLGRANNQIAIFDLNNMQEIRL